MLDEEFILLVPGWKRVFMLCEEGNAGGAMLLALERARIRSSALADTRDCEPKWRRKTRTRGFRPSAMLSSISRMQPSTSTSVSPP